MITNTEIKPWRERVALFDANYMTVSARQAADAEIAELRAALEDKQQAPEAANTRIEDLTTATNQCTNDALGMGSATEPPSFSRDPDGDLALDWRVGDASLSVSFSTSGLVSWATGVEGKSACGSQQVAQRAGSGAKPVMGTLVSDTACKQGKCAAPTTGCWGKCCLADPAQMNSAWVVNGGMISLGSQMPVLCAPPAAVQPDSRFFMDHGQWHDRVTGQHLWTQDQYDQQRIDWYKQGKEDAMLEQPDSGRDTCAQCGDTQEKAAQRKRVKDRFASWPASPATADFDLPMAIADDRADSGRDAALRPGIEYGPVVLAAMAAQQGEQAPGAKGRT